jgi:hypothetical protein
MTSKVFLVEFNIRINVHSRDDAMPVKNSKKNNNLLYIIYFDFIDAFG